MAKAFKRILVTLVIIVAFISAFVIISGRTYLFKAAWNGTANIDDYKIFESRTVTAGEAQEWPVSPDYNKINYPNELNSSLEQYNSVGLVVIKNDSLLFEKYWDGYSDSSLSGSFSIAKSITSLLIGVAIKEGKIKSVDQQVGDFLPEFLKKEKGNKLTIKHLLMMSSGTDWDESYNSPASITTEAYYGTDLYKTAMRVKFKREPGTFHTYASGDTQLLGLIIEKATGKSLSEYASEKLWKPLGAAHNALWSLDKKDGHEKAYCCFNTNARDFARLGQMMLDSGRWKGVPIIDRSYWKESITPCGVKDESGQACNYYGYQWWILPERQDVFYARGILGQYIVVIPSKKLVMVRLGKESATSRNPNAGEIVYWLVDWADKL